MAESGGTAGAGYRPRLADAYLADLMSDFPAVLVTGARATGKTTTAAQQVKQVDRLDQADVASAYRADPDAALRRATRPLLIDEWQVVPEVLAAVKRAVDADATPGQFILAGSASTAVGQDMWAGTGRLVHLNMFSLTERELVENFESRAPTFVERLASGGVGDLREPKDAPAIDDYVAWAVRGGFPQPTYNLDKQRSRQRWFSSYVEDLVTRDAAAVSTKDPEKLRSYLEVLALNNAGLPDDKSLYDAAGINARTAAGYDSLLQRLYILEFVPAWAQTGNRLKALAKRPKRYLVDSGLASAACGIGADDILGDSNLLGRTFDAFGTAQLRAENALADPPRRMHHLRAGESLEVDLVFDLGRRRAVGIEFKAAASVNSYDVKHLRVFRDDLGDRFLAGAVLYAGSKIVELDDRIYAIPLASVWA